MKHEDETTSAVAEREVETEDEETEQLLADEQEQRDDQLNAPPRDGKGRLSFLKQLDGGFTTTVRQALRSRRAFAGAGSSGGLSGKNANDELEMSVGASPSPPSSTRLTPAVAEQQQGNEESQRFQLSQRSITTRSQWDSSAPPPSPTEITRTSGNTSTSSVNSRQRFSGVLVALFLTLVAISFIIVGNKQQHNDEHGDAPGSCGNPPYLVVPNGEEHASRGVRVEDTPGVVNVVALDKARKTGKYLTSNSHVWGADERKILLNFKLFPHGIIMVKPEAIINGKKQKVVFYADDALVVGTSDEEDGLKIDVKDMVVADEQPQPQPRAGSLIRQHGSRSNTRDTSVFVRNTSTHQEDGGDVDEEEEEEEGVFTVNGISTDDEKANKWKTPSISCSFMKKSSPRTNKKAQRNEANDSFEHVGVFTFSSPVRISGLAMRGYGLELTTHTYQFKSGSGGRRQQQHRRVRNVYRLKNRDINHYTLDRTLGLYGSVPLLYVTGSGGGGGVFGDQHGGSNGTVGVFWLNAAVTEVIVEETFSTSLTNNYPPLENTRVATTTTLTIRSQEGGLKLFFLPGPTPADVLRQYHSLTGKPMLPPYFSLGYHQSRWSYKDQQDVLSVVSRNGFDKHRIPCDAIWLDIDHTDGKRYFTWDKNRFPDPRRMQETLWGESKRRLVTISDPHIKVDGNYQVYREGVEGGYFVKAKMRTRRTTTTKTNRITSSTSLPPFRGWCWPGCSHWIDFYNPKARTWYATLFQYDRYNGSTPTLYTWNDMNEPSVFSGGKELMMPLHAAVHFDGTNHGQLHNMYGFYQTMASFEGHLHRNRHAKKKITRPFILTRSFFAGSQRYAAVWNGDNQATWPHLRASVHMVLQMQLCGIPFVGADVGGFFDNPSAELLLRWYQLGALYPFFRGHSHEATRRREPWLVDSFDQLNQHGDRQERGDDQGSMFYKGVKAAIDFRYRLLPYLYTTFRDATTEGGSGAVWEPLFFAFPDMFTHPTTAGSEDMFLTKTFMVGCCLLAHPIVEKFGANFLQQEKKRTFTVTFPPSYSWHNYWTGQTVTSKSGQTTISFSVNDLLGKDTEETSAKSRCGVTPLWVKGGSIIAVKSIVTTTSTAGHEVDPYTLIIAPSPTGTAEGHVYLDDGEAYSDPPSPGGIQQKATNSGRHDENMSCVVHFKFYSGTLSASVSSGRSCPVISLDNNRKSGTSSADEEALHKLKVDQIQFLGVTSDITSTAQVAETLSIQSVSRGSTFTFTPPLHQRHDVHVKLHRSTNGTSSGCGPSVVPHNVPSCGQSLSGLVTTVNVSSLDLPLIPSPTEDHFLQPLPTPSLASASASAGKRNDDGEEEKKEQEHGADENGRHGTGSSSAAYSWRIVFSSSS